jgi:beta-glucosidase/6-phospho-beta-glucosidase/beta-galactosidase
MAAKDTKKTKKAKKEKKIDFEIFKDPLNKEETKAFYEKLLKEYDMVKELTGGELNTLKKGEIIDFKTTESRKIDEE